MNWAKGLSSENGLLLSFFIVQIVKRFTSGVKQIPILPKPTESKRVK
jgi:hypothetical protein